RYVQAVACPRAARKTATYRSLRLPTDSADAIGWHNSNLKIDLGLQCGRRRHPQIGDARASGCGRTKEIFTKEIPMNNENVTIHLKVKNYSIWQTGYDAREKSRLAAGISNGRVFRSPDDPNDVVILQDVADVSKARTWMASDEMKSAMLKGGVVGSPTIRFAAAA
ncbi:MAG: hypothetical protein ABSC37_22075, partial [Xanthobacteraceae bacterium]